MTTVQQIENELAQLQQKQAEIERAKLAAIEAEKQQRYDDLAAVVEQATAYRNEAAKATDDAEKKRLYQYADDAELLAVELRKELGLAEPDDAERLRLEQQKRRSGQLTRPFFSHIKKAIFLYIAFSLGDYFAGSLEVGFISFALKSVSQWVYLAASVLFGFGLVYVVLKPFFFTYLTENAVTDWKQAGPVARLVLLGLLIVATLVFIGFGLPNPN